MTTQTFLQWPLSNTLLPRRKPFQLRSLVFVQGNYELPTPHSWYWPYVGPWKSDKPLIRHALGLVDCAKQRFGLSLPCANFRAPLMSRKIYIKRCGAPHMQTYSILSSDISEWIRKRVKKITSGCLRNIVGIAECLYVESHSSQSSNKKRPLRRCVLVFTGLLRFFILVIMVSFTSVRILPGILSCVFMPRLVFSVVFHRSSFHSIIFRSRPLYLSESCFHLQSTHLLWEHS